LGCDENFGRKLIHETFHDRTTKVVAEGWNELKVGCVDRGDFSRTCKQDAGSAVEFEVDVRVSS